MKVFKNFLKSKLVRTKQWLIYKIDINFNILVKEQRLNPSLIPIIIINFNQLFYLRQLISFLQKRKFQKVIIIDNKSDYEPLLDYYKQIEQEGVIVEKMDKNYGHMVFFENKSLQKKYGKGYFVVTDADIVPNDKLPANFMNILIKSLDQNINKVTKVGFSLRIDDIPDTYPLKSKVIEWEKKYWTIEKYSDVYRANIDTTFALYMPGYPAKNSHISFYYALRFGGDFIARHGGWYINPRQPSKEYVHYQNTSTSSNSWKMDERGKLKGNYKNIY